MMIQEEVKKFVLNNFKNRIICLLSYGSRAINNGFRQMGDLDYFLVCDKFKNSDFVTIRELVKKYPQLDFNINYWDRILKKGSNNFQHGNHGIFFLNVFSVAKVIIGNNIFKEFLKNISKQDEINSLLFQIEEYFWRIGHWYIANDLSDKLNKKIKKYFFRICVDMILCAEKISYAHICKISHEYILEKYIMPSKIFYKRTKSLLKLLQKQEKVSEKTFCLLMDSLYKDYIKIYVKLKR